MSAFLKLPSDEVSRLGVNLDQDFVAGTIEAEELQTAWLQRQKELKEMMEKQLKAADHMKTLANYMLNSSTSNEDLEFYLGELEQLVSDIDNARDFHSIGGWPALTSLLPGVTQRPVSVQSKAVHCIGTAIKNDYDFQLWVLEGAGGQADGSTVLDILLFALRDVNIRAISGEANDDNKLEIDTLQRRILYAIAAAARGNMDVQSQLTPEIEIESSRPSFLKLLMSCIETPELSVGVKRKCWHIVADLLDEMVYIRHDIAQEYKAMQMNHDGNADDLRIESILEVLGSLRPLGMNFVSPDYEWLLLAQEVAAKISAPCASSGNSNNEFFDECIKRTDSQARDILAHAVKVRTILRAEYGERLLNDMQAFGDSTEAEKIVRLNKFKTIEEKHGADIDAFMKHPLMQDKLY